MSRFPRMRTSHYIKGFSMVELLVVVAIIGTLASLVISSYGGILRRSLQTKCLSNLKQIGTGMMMYVGDNDGGYPYTTDSADTNNTGSVMWTKKLGPYLPQRGNNDTSPESPVFICPAAVYTGYQNSKLSRTYTSTGAILYFTSSSSSGTAQGPARKTATVEKPSLTIMVVEGKQPSSGGASCNSATTWPVAQADLQAATTDATTSLDFRHDSRMNMIYADGHVGTLPFRDRASVTKPMWEGRYYTN